MRRFLILVGAVALAATMSAVAYGGSTPGPARNAFVGDFDLLPDGGGAPIGHITAQLFVPTNQRIVPGVYDFRGAPGIATREVHSVIGVTGFWYDENNPEPGLGGSNVAFAQGAECVYLAPNDAACHEFAIMFIDVLDPALPDQVAVADHRDSAGEWVFEQWFWVGKGEFSLKFYGEG